MARTEELLAAFESMTVLELSEFLHAFEDRFGVSATRPQTFVGDPPLDELTHEPEQDEFTVILDSAGSQKIQVIKTVRQLLKLGLKDAKDFVEALPRPVLEDADKDAAEQAKTALEAAGATVTLR